MYMRFVCVRFRYMHEYWFIIKVNWLQNNYFSFFIFCCCPLRISFIFYIGAVLNFSVKQNTRRCNWFSLVLIILFIKVLSRILNCFPDFIKPIVPAITSLIAFSILSCLQNGRFVFRVYVLGIFNSVKYTKSYIK